MSDGELLRHRSDNEIVARAQMQLVDALQAHQDATQRMLEDPSVQEAHAVIRRVAEREQVDALGERVVAARQAVYAAQEATRLPDYAVTGVLLGVALGCGLVTDDGTDDLGSGG